MDLSSTNTFPSFLNILTRIYLSPHSWIDDKKINKSWSIGFFFLFLASVFNEVSWYLINFEAAYKPFVTILGKSLVSFMINVVIIFIWAILIDFSAQIKGFSGNIKEIFLHFIYLQVISLFILPWVLMFWGLNFYPVFFYFPGYLLLNIWILILQIYSIKKVYLVNDTGKFAIFFLPFLIVSGFFSVFILILGFRVFSILA